MGWGGLASTLDLLGKFKKGTEGLNKLHSSLEGSKKSDRSILLGTKAA